MSVCAVWCKCSNGRWYENPVWFERHKDRGFKWYVCLDDDDPPELVMRDDEEQPKLSWAKFPKARPSGGCLRMLGPENKNGDRTFLKSRSVFGCIISAPPIPDKYSGSEMVERPTECAVYYDWKGGK